MGKKSKKSNLGHTMLSASFSSTLISYTTIANSTIRIVQHKISLLQKVFISLGYERRLKIKSTYPLWPIWYCWRSIRENQPYLSIKVSSFYFQAIKTNYDVIPDVSIFTLPAKKFEPMLTKKLRYKFWTLWLQRLK